MKARRSWRTLLSPSFAPSRTNKHNPAQLVYSLARRHCISNTMLTWLNLHRRKATICISLMLLLLFAPALVSVYWHIRYGNTVIYRGKKISVPARWVVHENQPQGLELYRMPITILGLRPLPSSSSFSRQMPPKIPIEEAYKSFQSVFWTVMANGGAVTGPIRFGE